MIRSAYSSDQKTITVFSKNMTIGGITFSGDKTWIWALFAVRTSFQDNFDQSYYGWEPTQEDAHRALVSRWSQWMSEAGLEYVTASTVH